MDKTEKLLIEASPSDLRLLLISYRLSTKGNKTELIERIKLNCSEEDITRYLNNPRYTYEIEYNSLKELSKRLGAEKRTTRKKRKQTT